MSRFSRQNPAVEDHEERQPRDNIRHASHAPRGREESLERDFPEASEFEDEPLSSSRGPMPPRSRHGSVHGGAGSNHPDERETRRGSGSQYSSGGLSHATTGTSSRFTSRGRPAPTIEEFGDDDIAGSTHSRHHGRRNTQRHPQHGHHSNIGGALGEEPDEDLDARSRYSGSTVLHPGLGRPVRPSPRQNARGPPPPRVHHEDNIVRRVLPGRNRDARMTVREQYQQLRPAPRLQTSAELGLNLSPDYLYLDMSRPVRREPPPCVNCGQRLDDHRSDLECRGARFGFYTCVSPSGVTEHWEVNDM